MNRRGSPRGGGGGYHRGGHHHHHHHHQQSQYVPPQNQLYVDTGAGGGGGAPPPQLMHMNFPNEAAESGMNGEGWQGPGGRGGGGGGSHHMNGGGGNRRGGGGYNSQRMGGQHHGNMNRMMPPAFRPQQQPYMPPYGPPMGGMPGDVLDLSMRMDGMSMSSTPGMAYEMGPPPGMPQGQWNQPAPFAPPPPVQDDLYGDLTGGGGGGGGYHQTMAPYGQQQQQPQQQQQRGNQYGNRNQGGGGNRYQPRNQNQGGGYMPPMMVAQNQAPFYNNQHQQQGQASFAPSPFSMSGSQTPLEHHMGHGGHSGSGYGGSQAGGVSQMDDYSMWTDENDEEAKRKKTLRDKGLLAWGDADASNSKPIRRWIVPEGQEEDFETAMERCPNHLKKRALNEEALRRKLASDNPTIVAQAQQQAEEEANATCKIGKRPIVASGWGELPSELGGGGAEKTTTTTDYDQGTSKGNWEDGLRHHQHQQHHQPPHHQPYHHQQHQQQHDDGGGSMWNSTLSGGGGNGGPSSNETRNPFFAHHMQQQAQQQQQQHYSSSSSAQGIYGGDNGVLLDTVGSVWSSGIDGGSPMGGHSQQAPMMMMGVGGGGGSAMPPIGMLSSASSSSAAAATAAMMMMASMSNTNTTNNTTAHYVDVSSQSKLAVKLKLAVDAGHLDVSLLSLPHIPPHVLDLLTEILAVIPRLDTFEGELTKLKALRPSNCDGEGTSNGATTQQQQDKNETSWMNKEQKIEHEKAMIGVVAAKIEVTGLAKKITDALIEVGLLPVPHAQSVMLLPGGHHHHQHQHTHHGGPPGGPPDGGRGGGGRPDHFYDYSFLG